MIGTPKKMVRKSKELLFVESAWTNYNCFNDNAAIIDWIERRKREVNVNINRLAFKDMNQWSFDEDYKKLAHASGKFFSIEGIRVQTNWGEVAQWDQPIINQPEIGFLGIICKEFDGVLYFLMQAKIEPGNINTVQVSPTLQATKSNYTQVHKGKKPPYLEYFLDKKKHVVLLDQLQSEQGSKFLKKRNRNIIIKIEEDIPPNDDFRWFTLGQIKQLVKLDNFINMDTRTVISGISFGSYSNSGEIFYNAMLSNNSISELGKKLMISEISQDSALHSIEDIMFWFTDLKMKYELEVDNIPLKEVKDWIIDSHEIRHEENKYFKVIGVNVEISNREVKSWDQPLVKPTQEGICAFIMKEINGVLHFLVQAKIECGNFDIIELAPTVQCLTGNYNNSDSKATLPFLDYVLSGAGQVITDTLQSEEGGRFYYEQNRSMILLVDDEFDTNVPERYTWMTLRQMKAFIRFNNYLNIQARSLLSLLSFTE